MAEEKKDYGIIANICNDTNALIDNTETITELLELWKEIDVGTKQLEATNDKIRIKIKNYLKERGWKRYSDEKTQIGVTITEVEREQIDKSQLKMILSDSQYAQVFNIKTSERLNIITPERRKELNKIVRK